jgi:hypothetical protein
MCVYIHSTWLPIHLRPDCDLVTRNVPVDVNVFAPLRTIVELQDLILKGAYVMEIKW